MNNTRGLNALVQIIKDGWKAAINDLYPNDNFEHGNPDILAGIKAFNEYHPKVDLEIAKLIDFVGEVCAASDDVVKKINSGTLTTEEKYAVYESATIKLIGFQVIAISISEHLQEVL